MIKLKLIRLKEFCCHGPGFVLLILPCILLLTLYLFTGNEFDKIQYYSYKSYNDAVTVDGFLVWNSKCHMPSKSLLDPSIVKFVKKEKFQTCTKSPLLTSIIQDKNGDNILMLNLNETKHLKSIFCCWAPINRPIPKKPNPQKNFDSSITIQNCVDFNISVIIPKEVDTLMVSCKDKKEISVKAKGKLKNTKHPVTIYQNVHSVINVDKVSDRFNISSDNNNNMTSRHQRKLSVLLLGIDNVSRLNLERNLPKTTNYLHEKGWLIMKGYDKMGENTFPNLMAILTGQQQTDSYDKCKPTNPFGLDHCPMLWYNFRNAGYVTAYAEDEAKISTFNYLKVGFVDPPTDYYLRPYILATEKLLKSRRRFANYYCTGPEVAAERILNSAVDFATKFQGVPYFGFFWTNSVSHDSINGLSSMDTHILSRLEYLEHEGIMNDTMIIFLSDHGMRIGDIRMTFMGWYEERLPFFYVWLPQWFRDENPEVYDSLTINQNRLTSPFDLYETLRDIVIRGGGEAGPSTGCPKCRSLFKTVPVERGCEDAGVPPHWCVCSAFEKDNASSQIVVRGAHKILDHIENIVKNYKTKKGKRLCAKFKLKKIHRIHKVIDLNNSNSTSSTEYFYMIQVTPGDAKFEATIHYYGSDNYNVTEEQISRINSYGPGSKCLDHGQKRYCHCIK
ncbi:uncharacterized protein LOC127288465 [Leptopilina boulardi]|uniref:uncharacterized protein LOC127288465 n=1 Tax=Leptopilina boulardi TaxID=63433 RepID=UPI0021F5FC6B|nr:uncharacterized protein LOC127288465 [Leptopilina boulardi]XP_051171896.1 uncharacterized protein LOC127288465 [Leptopilina boulardi]